MESTFHQGDFIIVDKVTPRFGTIHREDILVFVPKGEDVPFIKRVVGMPGETVVIDDGETYICTDQNILDPQKLIYDLDACNKLAEEYLDSDTITNTSCKKSVFPLDES
jgi:signal peptidase I